MSVYFPNAKINIGLNITEKRPDGYHNLETVFYPIVLQDALEVKSLLDKKNTEGRTYELKVSGELLDGSPSDNLVVKAYELLRNNAKYAERLQPISIHLYKHIPTGAGLGGGSSDAVFMLQALNQRFALGISTTELEELSAQLGADCKFFVRNQPAFATGVGDQLSDISLPLKDKTLVLVKPDCFVSTRDAYSAVIPHKPEISLREALSRPITEWKDVVVNDFERSVFPKYPEIAAIKDKLYDMGALYASMSGSGSAVYGIFENPQEHVDEIFSGYFCRQRTLLL